MRKVLVTGASGFVGGHVVHALRSRGIAARCLVRKTSRLAFIEPLAPELAFGDVTQPETLVPAIEGIDSVVHCAGLTKAASRAEFLRVNEIGSRNLYAACEAQKHAIRKIVHLSSLAALGPSIDGKPVTEESIPHPVSDYGESKLSGQRVAESRMPVLPISIVMPPAVYGPNDVNFLIYFKFVARGVIPLIGKSARYLSLIYVKDLARAVAEILVADQTTGRSYLVDDGSIHTWTSVANTIGEAMARIPRPIHLPVAAARGLGIMGDLYSKITGKASLISSQKIRELLPTSWTCSTQRICTELGFHPQYPLERGIRETLAWFKENKWL
jgi:nucleoside-diphosphate-sugar epimerase